MSADGPVGPNAAQAEFWNDRPGRAWVDHQDELDAMFAGVLGRLMTLAAPRPGERALDVGCGAGASTEALARAVAPGGEVVGVDVSEPLLARARARVPAARFERADAQVHPFEQGAFHLVASRFGVMFFDDPVAAFANLRGALRPGGRVAFAAWDAAERNPWFCLPERIGRERLGLPPAEPSDEPGPMAFRDVGRVVGILEAAGFPSARGETVDMALPHPGGVEGAVRLAGRIGPLGRLMREAEASEAERAAMLGAVAEAFAAFEGPDGLAIPARVHLFTASSRGRPVGP
jgi:SAM-dependent methyltransferase